jgi:hypothetical protein
VQVLYICRHSELLFFVLMILYEVMYILGYWLLRKLATSGAELNKRTYTNKVNLVYCVALIFSLHENILLCSCDHFERD